MKTAKQQVSKAARPKRLPEVERIVAKLGGDEAFRVLTGTQAFNLRNWYKFGIPPREWPAIIDAAASVGIVIEWRDFYPHVAEAAIELGNGEFQITPFRELHS